MKFKPGDKFTLLRIDGGDRVRDYRLDTVYTVKKVNNLNCMNSVEINWHVYCDDAKLVPKKKITLGELLSETRC